MKKASLFWVIIAGACFSTGVGASDFQNCLKNNHRQAVMQDDIRKWINKLYPDARILDRDSDNGFLEVKISHKGYEKIALFNPDNKKWLRTIWEIRREALPRRVLNRLESLGFALRYIDDNDNQAMQNRDGLFFAVQAEKGDHDYVFIISEKGKVIRQYRDREWDDDRWRGDFDMEGSLDEDDRWDDDRWDDGEDRFDEGDDEWDNSRRKIHYRDDGEDHFDEGDDEWDDGED